MLLPVLMSGCGVHTAEEVDDTLTYLSLGGFNSE
jgi:hypothetical protein